MIFAFDTSIQDKSEKALGLKDAKFLSDSYILLVSLIPLTFLSNLQLPEVSVCHFSGTMWHLRKIHIMQEVNSQINKQKVNGF